MVTRKVVFSKSRRHVAYPVDRGPNEPQKETPLMGPPLKGVPGGVSKGGATDSTKNQNSVDNLLARTNELTPTEKRELLDKLALELNSTGPEKGNRDVEMWASSVHKALTKISGDSYGILLIKKTLSVGSSWKPVEAFMSTAGFRDCSVIERQGIYNLLAGLLVEYAREVGSHRGIALTPKFVASCATSVAGVFESSFPGYVGSGLAKMVVKQLVLHA